MPPNSLEEELHLNQCSTGRKVPAPPSLQDAGGTQLLKSYFNRWQFKPFFLAHLSPCAPAVNSKIAPFTSETA